MIADVARFHRAGRHLLLDPPDDGYTLADMLAEGRWSRAFVQWYLVPLGSSIWSADPTTFTQMPATTLLRFFERHGMLSMGDKPAWRTVERRLCPLRRGNTRAGPQGRSSQARRTRRADPENRRGSRSAL